MRHKASRRTSATASAEILHQQKYKSRRGDGGINLNQPSLSPRSGLQAPPQKRPRCPGSSSQGPGLITYPIYFQQSLSYRPGSLHWA